MTGEAPYRMTLDLNVLNHLGINLYSNAPAVLAEVVANSWDADAENVWMDIDAATGFITIMDDGQGMTRAEVNDKYLYVGYRRREHGGAVTPKHGRPVMGRKGIGKLSLFSIANEIEVYTTRDGEKSGFRMSAERIREQITRGDSTYTPDPIDCGPMGISRGTQIRLIGLKRRLTQTTGALTRRLARRFSVIGRDSFHMWINGQEVTIADRGYFHKIQYLWYYGEDGSGVRERCINCEYSEGRPSAIPGTCYGIRGWIGTVRESGDLKEDGESINKIILMIRGKLAQEDILEEFGESGMYSKYVIGEIHADFLDADEEDDITTSSRQKIIEDDRRYAALKKMLARELKHLQNSWTNLRNEAGASKACEIAAIEEWFKGLTPDMKKRAKSLFGRIYQMTVSDEQRRQLFKFGVLAFENLKYRENLDALEAISVENLPAIAEMFTQQNDIEATLYHQIVKSRVEVIRALREKVEENAREKVIQEHVFKNLWLLDPSWERVAGTEYMEQRVETEFRGINATLDPAERDGRVDIKYRTAPGTHVIIELKKADRRVTSVQLVEQVDKYRNALKRILAEIGEQEPRIEVVCIVGRPLIDWDDPGGREESDRMLEAKRIRVVLYQTLIQNAYKAYSEFIDKDREIGKVQELIRRIEGDLLNDGAPEENGAFTSQPVGAEAVGVAQGAEEGDA